MSTAQAVESIEFHVADGALTLRGDARAPENPCAVLGIVHGLGEHHARYDAIADSFVDHGIAVYKYDHPGHGVSDGPRGHADSMDVLLDGVDALVRRMRADHPNVPILLWGHSMGGGIVINYMLRRNTESVGSIVTAPFLELPVKPSRIQMFMARIMNVIYPALTQDNSIDTKYLSHDAAEVKKYEDDPLVHPLVSARLILELFAAADWSLSHAGELKTPMLILHGDEDRLTSAEGSRKFAAASKCAYHEYEGGYHELHFDNVRDDVIKRIIGFIDETVGASE